MTQQDLANATGLALATISRVETNKHVPETATKQVLARALGVPVEELNPGRVFYQWGAENMADRMDAERVADEADAEKAARRKRAQ